MRIGWSLGEEYLVSGAGAPTTGARKRHSSPAGDADSGHHMKITIYSWSTRSDLMPSSVPIIQLVPADPVSHPIIQGRPQ